MPPLSLTRIAFPASHPTASHRDLILQAVQGWGDPEQLTDPEAVELKKLCATWFGLDATSQLQARTWFDALVFTEMGEPRVEYAIIAQGATDTPVLYTVYRGHRLIPAAHGEMKYLEHLMAVAVDESD